MNIPADRETRIFVTAGGNPPVAPDIETITFEAANQYTIQAEQFAQAVISGTAVPIPGSNAVANMALIEAILAAG